VFITELFNNSINVIASCYLLSTDPMDKPFQNREFNFVKPGDDEVYMRYLSFDTIEEFKNEVLRVCPKKIDIGAVFTAKVIYL
jgi:DNA primase small subunit